MFQSSPAVQQQRIIRSFARRNIQGWGRPLSFTVQKLRMGGLFGLAALAFALFDGLFTGVHPTGFLGTFLNIVIILCMAMFLSALWTHGITYIRATQQPQEHITGTVNVAICDAKEAMPFARDLYHFITVRKDDGKLRAFAINPELHDQVCQAGQRITLTVIPGIDYVVAAK